MTKFKLLAVCLSLMLIYFVNANAAPLTYSLGDTIQDFSFTTYDGEEITLSSVLAEKQVVLLNIWATWCGPCRSEFPYMQEAYEKYQDQVEVIALSCESTDTPDKLADFAQEYGLTFKIGQDPVGFLEALGTGSIPTTLMIDRFGTICLIESGAQPSAEIFERMFDAFLGDEYTESVLYRGVPSAKPNVEASTSDELTAALESPSVNPTNAYTWPMLVTEKDGRSVVASSNAGQATSEATVSATLHAKAGDAIVVAFKTSTEQTFDLLQISINGNVVKVFGGEHDWMDYAIPVEADGEYVVKLSYIKDNRGDAGDDTVWIDRIALASDAATALQANPVVPVAETLSVMPTNTDAREITIEDKNGLLRSTFGAAKYYIINADEANVLATLTSDYDAEAAFLYTSAGMLYPLADLMQDNGYALSVAVDSAATTGYACTSVILYHDNTGLEYTALVLFRDEENVIMLCNYNGLGDWAYVTDDASSAHLSLPAQADYTFKCIDQQGNPVIGAMLQVCDDTTCQVLISDNAGICTFAAAPYSWEVHILMAPAGYSADSSDVVLTPADGGEMTFTFTKE